MVAVFQFPHLNGPAKSFHGIHVNKGIPSIWLSSEKNVPILSLQRFLPDQCVPLCIGWSENSHGWESNSQKRFKVSKPQEVPPKPIDPEFKLEIPSSANLYYITIPQFASLAAKPYCSCINIWIYPL